MDTKVSAAALRAFMARAFAAEGFGASVAAAVQRGSGDQGQFQHVGTVLHNAFHLHRLLRRTAAAEIHVRKIHFKLERQAFARRIQYRTYTESHNTPRNDTFSIIVDIPLLVKHYFHIFLQIFKKLIE